MSLHAYSVQLVPEGAWRPVSATDAEDIWITVSSINGVVSQREPAVADTPSRASSQQIFDAIRPLDETTIVIVEKSSKRVLIKSGSRSSDRVYVSTRESAVRIASGIQHAGADWSDMRLSRRFIAVWLASALRFGNLDHFLGCSPFEGIHLVANGVSLAIDLATGNSSVSVTCEPPTASENRPCTLEHLIFACRAAVFQAIETQTAGADVVSECSGGIDSGLVTVIAKRVIPDKFRGGVFVDYPYHEFRKEKEYVGILATAERFPILPADPSLAEFWGALIHTRMPRQSVEPSLFSPFWGQVLAGHHFVENCAPSVILTGLGGDLLFEYRESPYKMPPIYRPEWLGRDVWDYIVSALDGFEAMLSSHAQTSSGVQYNNPWISKALGHEFPGSTYCSPLTERAVVSSFSNLRDYIRNSRTEQLQHFPFVQKPLAHLVFNDYLPTELWHRRSKIDFVGNFYRFWWNHGQSMVRLIEKMQPQLDGLGIDPRALLTQVKGMSKGRCSANVILNAVVTYSVWLYNMLNDCAQVRHEKPQIPR